MKIITLQYMHTPVLVKNQHVFEESYGCNHHCHLRRMMMMNCSLYQRASLFALQTCLHNTDLTLVTFVFHPSQYCSIVKKLILLALTPSSNILHLLRALLTIYFGYWAEIQHKGSHLDFLLEEDAVDAVGLESHN